MLPSATASTFPGSQSSGVAASRSCTSTMSSSGNVSLSALISSESVAATVIATFTVTPNFSRNYSLTETTSTPVASIASSGSPKSGLTTVTASFMSTVTVSPESPVPPSRAIGSSSAIDESALALIIAIPVAVLALALAAIYALRRRFVKFRRYRRVRPATSGSSNETAETNASHGDEETATGHDEPAHTDAMFENVIDERPDSKRMYANHHDLSVPNTTFTTFESKFQEDFQKITSNEEYNDIENGILPLTTGDNLVYTGINGQEGVKAGHDRDGNPVTSGNILCTSRTFKNGWVTDISEVYERIQAQNTVTTPNNSHGKGHDEGPSSSIIDGSYKRVLDSKASAEHESATISRNAGRKEKPGSEMQKAVPCRQNLQNHIPKGLSCLSNTDASYRRVGDIEEQEVTTGDGEQVHAAMTSKNVSDILSNEASGILVEKLEIPNSSNSASADSYHCLNIGAPKEATDMFKADIDNKKAKHEGGTKLLTNIDQRAYATSNLFDDAEEVAKRETIDNVQQLSSCQQVESVVETANVMEDTSIPKKKNNLQDTNHASKNGADDLQTGINAGVLEESGPFKGVSDQLDAETRDNAPTGVLEQECLTASKHLLDTLYDDRQMQASTEDDNGTENTNAVQWNAQPHEATFFSYAVDNSPEHSKEITNDTKETEAPSWNDHHKHSPTASETMSDNFYDTGPPQNTALLQMNDSFEYNTSSGNGDQPDNKTPAKEFYDPSTHDSPLTDSNNEEDCKGTYNSEEEEAPSKTQNATVSKKTRTKIKNEVKRKKLTRKQTVEDQASTDDAVHERVLQTRSDKGDFDVEKLQAPRGSNVEDINSEKTSNKGYSESQVNTCHEEAETRSLNQELNNGKVLPLADDNTKSLPKEKNKRKKKLGKKKKKQGKLNEVEAQALNKDYTPAHTDDLDVHSEETIAAEEDRGVENTYLVVANEHKHSSTTSGKGAASFCKGSQVDETDDENHDINKEPEVDMRHFSGEEHANDTQGEDLDEKEKEEVVTSNSLAHDRSLVKKARTQTTKRTKNKKSANNNTGTAETENPSVEGEGPHTDYTLADDDEHDEKGEYNFHSPLKGDGEQLDSAMASGNASGEPGHRIEIGGSDEDNSQEMNNELPSMNNSAKSLQKTEKKGKKKIKKKKPAKRKEAAAEATSTDYENAHANGVDVDFLNETADVEGENGNSDDDGDEAEAKPTKKKMKRKPKRRKPTNKQ